MKLIIVESPTKAKTFGRLLPAEYVIKASVGHIRDLPQKKIGVDLEHDFEPVYEVSKEKKKTLSEISSLAKRADTIILATDADREGEAISYHIAHILGFTKEKWPTFTIQKNAKLQRIVFHEITKTAILEALAHPGTVNMDLVNAQQARRILDRIVGYKVSPLLWNKLGKRWLSAGRVQTVALRFISEREREIRAFTIEPYYKINGNFTTKAKLPFEAKLVGKGTQEYYTTKKIQLFDGSYTFSKTSIDKALSQEIDADLKKDTCLIETLTKSAVKRTPPPPFTTSTLQQEAARVMGYSSKYTMSLAQKLYEAGHITYHRTDSVNLSAQFIEKATAYAQKTYGDRFVQSGTRAYKAKSKLAQEAHEAIRPTKLKTELTMTSTITPRHQKLYNLIFNKALSTVMKDAELSSYGLKIQSKKGYRFETRFETIDFEGFLILYGKKSETSKMSDMKKGEEVDLKSLMIEESKTNPPPRYTEASLIKTLESKGIGRPSTYAPIISTIQDRQYVEKQDGKFYSTMLGTAVSDYLSGAISEVFDIDFTAEMEDKLDKIAIGKGDTVAVLKKFYAPLEKTLEKEFKEKKYIDVAEKTDEKCPECGAPMLMRYSKFGKFYACSRYPECKGKKSFQESIPNPCPKCGGKILVRLTKKKRRFYGCSNYPTCTYAAWNVNQIEKDSKPDVSTPAGDQDTS